MAMKKMMKKSAMKSAMKGMSWIAAVAKARKELKIKGFMAIKKGTALYKRAKALQGS